MMSTITKINVNRDVSRIKTHPSSRISEKIVKAKSNESDAVKTRKDFVSNSTTRKRKTGYVLATKNLYTPKTYFEKSQYFGLTESEPITKVISSNKERKRQLNWREFSLDVLGNKISWDDIKSEKTFSPDLSYQTLEFDDSVVFQVIEPVKEKLPTIVEILGRKHVIDYDYTSETNFTSLGVFQSSFRTFSQNVRNQSFDEMETLNEIDSIVVDGGAHCPSMTLDDAQENEKPVPYPRTVFFPTGFKAPVPTPRSSLESLDLVPEERIFKKSDSSFNQHDPLFLAVCKKRADLVKAAVVKPGLSYATSTSHHKSDVFSASVRSALKKVELATTVKPSGLYYEFEPTYLGSYTYTGFDDSNPVYLYPKYVPSFSWNKNKHGKIERFTVSDFNEKKSSRFEKIVTSQVTVFENMNTTRNGKRVSFSPTTKNVTFKVYTNVDEPLCKKCKGVGCAKCNLWGSPITVKPEKWFEELSPLDNSLSPKITALKVTLSKEDKVKEL